MILDDELEVAVRAWLAFHCGAPLTEVPAEALFALAAEPARLPELALFAQGTQDYPDRSTTLILAVATLEDGPALRLTGPGIERQAREGLVLDLVAPKEGAESDFRAVTVISILDLPINLAIPTVVRVGRGSGK